MELGKRREIGVLIDNPAVTRQRMQVFASDRAQRVDTPPRGEGTEKGSRGHADAESSTLAGLAAGMLGDLAPLLLEQLHPVMDCDLALAAVTVL